MILHFLLFPFLVVISYSHECLIDIAILAFGQSYNHEIISSLHSDECEIESIFWITDMTYNSTILENDLNMKQVKIVRENIETNGYTAFLLPLLENNTYSLVINLDNWSISKENWIDNAIQEVRKPKQVYACDVYNDFDCAIGCLLLSSLMLRSLWTNTEFRISSISAIERVSLAIQCKYHVKIVTNHLNNMNIKYSGDKSIMDNCIERLSIQDMKCSSKRKDDNSVAVYFTQYKRNYLDRQLPALFQSSVHVNELVIYQGEQHYNYGPIIKKYPQCKHFWTTNWNNPFFLRFLIPFLVDSYYIFNIDDDVLVKNQTLESMMDVVKRKDAITSFEGRIIDYIDYNKPILHQTCVKPIPDVYQTVDFLVISYCMKLEYVKIFWRYRYMMERNGEDIHLSAANRIECNRPSIIRKKIPNGMFIDISHDKNGASLKPTHFSHRGQLLRTWIMSGYSILKSKALVYFPKMTNQTMDYFRSNIRYEDYH